MNRLFYLLACYLLDDLISVAYLLSFKISFLIEIILECLFHVDKLAKLVEEPLVYLSDAVYLINRNSTSESLVYNEKSFVCAIRKSVMDSLVIKVKHLR